MSMALSFIAIFIVTFLLLGLDVFNALIVILTIMMIIVDLGGLMWAWGIDLNAVSLVNLVMVRESVRTSQQIVYFRNQI